MVLFFLIEVTCATGQERLLERAGAAYQRSDYKKAYVLYQTAADSFYLSSNSEAYVDAYLKMADCKLQSGEPSKTISLAKNALEFLSNNPISFTNQIAKAQTLLGLGHLNLGRNDEALASLLAAEQGFSTTNASGDKANCLDAIGLVYTSNGNLKLASQYLEKGFKLRRKLFGAQSIPVANSYNNLGRVYLKEDPLQALIYFNRAKGIYESILGSSNQRTLRSKINIAYANTEQANYEEALKELNEVKTIYETLYDNDHPEKAYIQTLIGSVHLKTGDYDLALVSQRSALQLYVGLFGEKHPDVANTYFLIGEIMRAKRDYKEAVDFYQQSVYANIPDQTYTDLYDLPDLANFFNSDYLLSSIYGKAVALSDLHFEKSLNVKDLIGSIEAYKKCDDLISIIRRNRLNEQDKIKLGALAKEVYENGIQLSLLLSEQSFNKKKYLEIAFEFCERSKSAVLLEAIADAKAKKYVGIPESQIVLEDSLKDEISYLEQQVALTENTTNDALKDLLFAYRNSYREFVQKLEINYPEYYKLKYNQQSASATDIQRRLKKNQALIAYFNGEDDLYSFIITQKKITSIAQTKTQKIERLTSGFRNAIRYNSDQAFISTSKDLYGLLVPKLPASIQELILIPDEVLGTIPFEALIRDTKTPDLSSAAFLIQDYHISYDYSATLFTERETSTEKLTPAILLVAPVSFSQQDVAMQDLPGSEAEIKEIKYLFMGNEGKTTTQEKANASEFNLKEENLDKYQYLHFATHGIVNASEPALSRIFLNPGNDEDGSLYTGEIYNLKIGADLVTLSACETGLGQVAKGEGIVGLSRALQYAGANNIVVSLWQVADASTSQLMIDFYTYYLSNGHHGYNAALRHAKLALLKSEDYNKPYYWAPFILVGQ